MLHHVEYALDPVKILLWVCSSKTNWSACVWNMILLEGLRTRAWRVLVLIL